MPDLISTLPDELLTHILSFLPTKTSFTTTLLSKRWSGLWLSVPNVDFFGFGQCLESQAQFENFMDRFLTLNTVKSVRTIQFDATHNHDDEETEVSRLNAWLAAISERDAEEIQLTLPGDHFYETFFEPGHHPIYIYRIPDAFFIQKNLVKLKLCTVVLKVPHLVFFPNLKKINLDFIQFFDNISLKNLLSGSPVLGKLFINIIQGNTPQTLYVRSSSLRKLRIDMDPDQEYDYRIVIDTPILRDLWLSDDYCSTYKVINLSSLVRATLLITKVTKKQPFFELLTRISHVKELVLHGHLGFDYTNLVPMPIFNNVIHLEVKFDWMEYSESLFHLFKCTPNLVTLTLIDPVSANSARAWSEPHEVPRCFLSSIESVDIKWDGGSDQEVPLISYILKNAMVLKKLSLRRIPDCAKDLVKENKFLLTLSTLPRSSAIATCQFI